jgi:hypothetical protein
VPFSPAESLPARLAAQITDRDRYLTQMLAEHRVLTSQQITDLAFDSPITARHRLQVLTGLQVAERFRPRRQCGSAPWHYVLGSMGALLASDTLDSLQSDPPSDPGPAGRRRWRRDKALSIAASARLPHLVGVNSVFTGLARAARAQHGCELAVWWSERRCAAAWGDLARPDGYGLWCEHGARVPFWLEYDTGSEHLPQLAGKLAGYTELAAVLDGPTPWLLVVLPGLRRETEARRALRAARLPLATAVLAGGTGAAGPVWLPLHGQQRRPLAGLAAQARSRPEPDRGGACW